MPDRAYALPSPAVLRAAPNRGGKAAATSHKQNVVRKAERQDNDKENELMINTFLNPAPRAPAVHGGLKKKRNTDMIYIGKA